MQKCIANQTELLIFVTLYVAEFTPDGFRTKETHTIDIQPNEYKDITYGSAANAFISGLDVCAEINGATITTSQKSGAADSPFSLDINQKHLIEIKGVRTLDIELVG